MGVAPPCTQVLPTECKRKSPPWPHPPSRSKSLLHLRENTLYGSEDPSWLLFPPPTDVDHQARIRRVRPIHCPQKMLLSTFALLLNLNISFCSRSGVNFNLQHSKIQNFKILSFFVKCKFKISFGIKLPIWL